MLRTLFADRDRDALVEALVARRIPAAAVVAPTAIHLHPQMVARGFFAAPPHAVVGTMAIPGLPFRCRSIDELVRGAAPTMGADNGEILGGWLGLSADELASLEADGVIGTRPTGL
jgi:crotonobetainyl-CoA:carnitine CoA-transferase CaiB-like acyl-CoA transferase